MAIDRVDTTKPGTSGWWLNRLGKQLSAQQAELKLYDDYYAGRHRLSFASAKFREAFGTLFSAFAVNFCPLVVDAVTERLHVEGFRLDSPDSDEQAWTIWQANQLDAESELAHREALIKGRAFALVWTWAADRRPWWLAALKGRDIPRITIEDATEMVVETDPGDRRTRRAALKQWTDGDAHYATLYLPDRIEKWQRFIHRPPETMTQVGQDLALTPGAAQDTPWVPREVPGEAWPLSNPLKVVPVVPLLNRTRLVTAPMSELAEFVAVQDAINKLIADMIVASEYAAYPQRYAIGLELPSSDAEQSPMIAAISRLWEGQVPDNFDRSRMPDPQFGQFEAADLKNYVSAIEMLVRYGSFITRTPPHYFIGPQGQPASGESIKSSETGLVAKVHSRMRALGEGYEEAIRLGFAAIGDDKRAQVLDSETIWGDPESRSEAEHVDALLKLKALGVPDQQLQADAGYTPQQISRFAEMRASLALEIGNAFDPFASADSLARNALEQARKPVEEQAA